MTRPQRLVKEMCLEERIPFQDLLTLFAEHNTESLFIPRDGHLNEAGHALVSGVIADFVRQHASKDD